jgi:hypothetical protein
VALLAVPETAIFGTADIRRKLRLHDAGFERRQNSSARVGENISTSKKAINESYER